jgi:hypothetical protein
LVIWLPTPDLSSPASLRCYRLGARFSGEAPALGADLCPINSYTTLPTPSPKSRARSRGTAIRDAEIKLAIVHRSCCRAVRMGCIPADHHRKESLFHPTNGPQLRSNRLGELRQTGIRIAHCFAPNQASRISIASPVPHSRAEARKLRYAELAGGHGRFPMQFATGTQSATRILQHERYGGREPKQRMQARAMPATNSDQGIVARFPEELRRYL